MRTVSKMVFVALLLSLLTAWAGACHARFHHPIQQGQTARHPARIRLRRTGKQHPARCPLAPQTQIAMPPVEDDDDDGRDRAEVVAACDGTSLSPLPAVTVHAMRFRSRLRRLPDAPLYQTLGILLI